MHFLVATSPFLVFTIIEFLQLNLRTIQCVLDRIGRSKYERFPHRFPKSVRFSHQSCVCGHTGMRFINRQPHYRETIIFEYIFNSHRCGKRCATAKTNKFPRIRCSLFSTMKYPQSRSLSYANVRNEAL